jgi:hypothetical protein
MLKRSDSRKKSKQTVANMTERYITASGTAYVWHNNPDCPLVGDNELEPVPESEVPDPAHACSGCADGLTATDLREMGEGT